MPTMKPVPATSTQVPRSILRRVRFVDLMRCVNDTNGNPRGVFLLRSADGTIIARVERGYRFESPSSLCNGIVDALGLPRWEGKGPRGAVTFDVSPTDVRERLNRADADSPIYSDLPRMIEVRTVEFPDAPSAVLWFKSHGDATDAPGCVYGTSVDDWGPVAFALAEVHADASGEEIDGDALDAAARTVVNDGDCSAAVSILDYAHAVSDSPRNFLASDVLRESRELLRARRDAEQ